MRLELRDLRGHIGRFAMNNSVFRTGFKSIACSALSLSLSLSVIESRCFAQEEEEFAEGAREDAWGRSYQVTEVPTTMTDFLDEEGRWIVPSFMNATLWRNGHECWVI
jgi:hypothetical protein